MAEIQMHFTAQPDTAVFEERIQMSIDATNAALIGTGDLSGMAAVDGYRAFWPAFQTEKRFYYVLEQRASPFKWEIGIGYHSTISTIVRETVIRNSDSGTSKIDFSDEVELFMFNTIPAVYMRRSNFGRTLAAARGLAMP